MDDSDLSYDEMRARRSLIRLCVEIARDYADELDKELPRRSEFEGDAQ
jgi:hypothetical protein